MEALIITSTGNILPCATFPDTKNLCGNVKQTSIVNIWNESTFIMRTRKTNVNWINKCNNCSLKQLCGGGCRAISYKKFGKIDSMPDSESCIIKAGAFSCIGELYNEFGAGKFRDWFDSINQPMEKEFETLKNNRLTKNLNNLMGK